MAKQMSKVCTRRLGIVLLVECIAVVALGSWLAWMMPNRGLTRMEYLAMVPNGQGPMKQNGPYIVDWAEISYPADGEFRAKDVKMRHLPVSEGKAVAGLRNLDLGASGAMLTGRHHGGNLYVFINTGKAPVARGCCADTVRIFPDDGTAHKDVVIVDVVRKLVESVDGVHFHGISHSFHPVDIDGNTVFLLPIIYHDARLSGSSTDAVLALNMATLTAYPTADGDVMFSPFRQIGTLDSEDDIFKVRYKVEGGSVFQQWHANCVISFTAADGTDVLAISQRMDVEAVLIKNPYIHKKEDGGGQVLQRFGSPRIFNEALETVGQHNFGVRAEDSVPIVNGNPRIGTKANGGVHNLFHQRYSDGRETLTMFCNQLRGRNQSGLFEFDVRLAKQVTKSPTDHVFDTNYTLVPLPMSSMAQGGARPIGHGVYMVATGLSDMGYLVADTSGGVNLYEYSYKLLYDPFTFLSWTEPSPSRPPMRLLLGLGVVAVFLIFATIFSEVALCPTVEGRESEYAQF